MTNNANMCTRCGNERILAKEWEERVETVTGFTLVRRALYVCADGDCQEKVQAALDEKRKAAEERKLRAEERAQARMKARSKQSTAAAAV